MAKSAVLRTVAVDGHRVGRRTDAEYGRERKYLTPAEVERLIDAARFERRPPCCARRPKVLLKIIGG
jgi:hypothetical protein